MSLQAKEPTKPTLYGEVADQILTLIEQGTFREGDKVPSIRSLSEQFDVSVNTVKEAYFLLEKQRFLEAKPQSGYYVRRKVLPLPGPATNVSLNPLEVSMCRIYGEVTRDNRNTAGASLAIAIPDHSLLPAKRLNQEFQTVWKTLGQDTLTYSFSPGLTVLREQIAQHSLESGVRVSPDDILITSGASEAITLTLLVLCKPGDTVAVESPTYFNFLHLIKELGLKVLEIPTSAQEGVQLSVLSWALETHEVKAFIGTPNFNNPLGFRMSEANKRALVELLESKNVPFVEDDIYGELPFAGKRPIACKSFDRSGNVILVSSFSKTLAPGYRIGWVVPGQWQAPIDKMKSLTSVASPTPNQMAIARYLENGGYERHLRNLRQHLADQTGEMAELVAQSFPEGTKVSRPAGGFVLWVELPVGYDTTELYERTTQEGIVFSPGEIFSASGRFKNALRLNAGIWNPQVAEAVKRIGAMARSSGWANSSNEAL